MQVDYWIGAAIAALLGVYLIYALVRAEKLPRPTGASSSMSASASSGPS